MSTALEAGKTPAGQRSVVDWFTTEELYRDPYPIWKRLRRDTPVAWAPAAEAWLIAKRQDLEDIYTDRELISAEVPDTATNRSLGAPNILTVEGPAHAEIRGSINQVLLPRTVDTYVDSLIAPIVQQYLDRLPESGVVDIHHQYFEPISVLSLGALIGLGHVSLEKMQYWFHSLSAGAFNVERDPEKERISAEARADVVAHLDEVFDRVEREPDGSLISDMLHNGMPPGQTRSRESIIPTLLVIIVGGAQEPGHGTSMLFHGLFQNPDQLEDLKGDVETLLPRAINEGLRWQPPLGTLERVAVKDFTLRGQLIRKGEMIMFLIGSINRDEDWYEDGDSFDLHRSEGTHRAFGMGGHMCMGHWFARRQMQISVRSLLNAYPDLGPVPGDVGELTGWAARGPVRLPADLGRRAGAYTVEPTVQASQRRALTIPVKVESVDRVAEDVIALTFVAAGGGELPIWEPGAHVDLHIADGLIRQYSLCGDPGDRQRYRIAVRRDPGGRGGSLAVHERVTAGSLLELGLPRNHFPLQKCDTVVFVAGGIGITPLVPMMRAAQSTGADWRLLYLARSREHMAFAEDLAAHGERVLFWESDVHGLLDLEAHLRDLPSDAQVYSCGPAPLTNAVREAVPPGVEVRSESFVPPVLGETLPDVAFELEIEGTDRRTIVPPGRSVLQALEELDVFVTSGCTVGVCGSCVTTVVEGEIEHRDAVLSEAERAAGDSMAVCVSRCRSGRLVLRPETS